MIQSGPGRRPPRELRGWLGVSGSFTEALRRHCQGAIRAQILRQAHVRPRPDEARLLRLGPGEQALLRESLLYCSHCPTPWIHARTLIPLRHLRGTLKPLARWGSRPIGDLLFRSPCQARRLRLDILRLAGTPATAGRLWARRSLYQSCDQRLLVQEILLPALLPFRE